MVNFVYIIFNLYIPKGWKLYSAPSCEPKALNAAVLVLAALYKNVRIDFEMYFTIFCFCHYSSLAITQVCCFTNKDHGIIES